MSIVHYTSKTQTPCQIVGDAPPIWLHQLKYKVYYNSEGMKLCCTVSNYIVRDGCKTNLQLPEQLFEIWFSEDMHRSMLICM